MSLTRRTRSNNQYFAELFERLIVSIANNESFDMNVINFKFTEDDYSKVFSDAKNVVEQFFKGKYVEYVGRKTSTADCDFIVDGQHVEIKYVGSSNGTYYNTTLLYFSDKFDLTSYNTFMQENGLLDYLSSFYGSKVYNNVSPLTIKESKDFRHNHKEQYEVFVRQEAAVRKKYVNYIYNYFLNNIDSRQIFVADMLGKTYSNKRTPDLIIVYNYQNNTINSYTKKDILSYAADDGLKNSGLSLNFGKMRIAIGWQNGNGLNNPTIRVFLN